MCHFEAAASRHSRAPMSPWAGPDEARKVSSAVPLASCFWCERLHPAAQPLSVCAACVARLSTMRSLEMSGCYPLSDEAIDGALTRTSPGNYALGYMDGDVFSVFFVGRADGDLRQRLHAWVDMPSRYEKYACAAKASWGLQRRQRHPLGAPTLGRVENAESRYTHFAFSYAPSAEEAYAKEWRNYDSFGGRYRLDNEREPVSSMQS